MNPGLLWSAAVLASAAVVLAGCVTPRDRAESAGTGSVLPISGAEQLAIALADADAAFHRRDRKRLASALARIDAIGGRPAEGHSTELAQWRGAIKQDSPPMRGRPLGPGFRSGELSPGSSDEIEQLFLSGKRASVSLMAPNGARLTLKVEDRRNAPVCGRDGNPSHCQWVPTFSDRYRIRISNPGTAMAKYFLVVD